MCNGFWGWVLSFWSAHPWAAPKMLILKRVNKNVKITDHIFGTKFLNCSKSAINWRCNMIRDFVYKGLTKNPESWTISGDWGELGISDLARMSLIKSYLMSQNARIQLWPFLSYYGKTNKGREKITPPIQISVNISVTVNGPELLFFRLLDKAWKSKWFSNQMLLRVLLIIYGNISSPSSL